MDDTKILYHSLSNAATATNNAEDPNLINPTTLCETLFDHLNAKFREFFSALPLHDHDTENRFPPPPHSRLWLIVEDLALLLRCSLVVLTLPYSDQKFLIYKCRSVLRILKAFLSVDVTDFHDTTVLRFRNFLSDVHMELSDSCRPFLCAVLEVFADELLRHKSLRRYLMIADSASSNNEKIFVCCIDRGDIVSVLEVISTHFILSVSNEKAFENFTSRLLLHDDDKDFRFLKLGVVPSIALLLDPVLHSAPKMFQAHLISLVSEAISSGLSSEKSAADMGCYLMAFQTSVIWYSMHVSRFLMDGSYIEENCAYKPYLSDGGHPTFESYIQQGTSNRLNQVLSKSIKSWDSHRFKMASTTKADLLTGCIEFMKGRQYIFKDSYGDEAALILEFIIHRASFYDAAGGVLYIKQNTSAEDICLLASILKLICVSLLQAIKCLSNSGDSVCLKTMESSSVRDKYDFLISTIGHFQQFKFCPSSQNSLYDKICQQTNYKVSKSMFVHFSGLLSFSFSNGFDLLAKGCVSVIMALMYMFVFEEGDLVALESLKGLPLRSCSSEISSHKSGERAGDKRTIYKVAAEFHRIRTHKLRTDSISSCNIVEDGTEEACNGKMYLDCIFEYPQRVPDFDELADFLECQTGKDYSSWLNRREDYRKRRKKLLDLRKKNKKEAVWKSLKYKKNVKSLSSKFKASENC